MGQVENSALRLTNVSKSYGRVQALENLSFSVAEGRFFVLFGPSSVGKTTALRTIAGLVTPERGRLEIFGKDWTQEPIAGRGVSMVFQSFALYPHLTVYKNFAYPLVEAEARTRGDRWPREGDGGDAQARRQARPQAQHAVGWRTTARRLGPFLDPPAQDSVARRTPDESRREASP